jgi:nanoRNase/pAp phosphatase (c-di-AMP/oligoRNAs hydrolase)
MAAVIYGLRDVPGGASLKVALLTYGPINRRVALMLRDRVVDLLVLEDADELAERAVDDGLECRRLLVSDPGSEEVLEGTEAFVMMDMDPLRVDRVAKSLRRRFPHARIIAPDVAIQELKFLETYTSDGHSVRIGQEVLANAVVSAVEDHLSKRSTDRLVQVLKAGGEGEVAVFTHDDPDPDAIASGLGVVRICEELELKAQVYHGGRLNRLQNRFFARLIKAPLASITAEEAEVVAGRAARVVLVDAGKPGVHNVLPTDIVPNIVLDHHSTNREVSSADFCDVRPGLGSTSTMVTRHLQEMGIIPDPELAASLLFGLRTDTDHLRRNTSSADMRASAYLASLADQELLDLVEHPPIAPDIMDVIGRGVLARRRMGDNVLAWCGEVGSRDDLPQVADFLLQEEDVAAVYVFGQVGGRVLVSARSVLGGPHVGDLVKDALGDIGTGGGHANMAGGSVQLLGGVDLDVDKWVEEELFEAFIDSVGARQP